MVQRASMATATGDSTGVEIKVVLVANTAHAESLRAALREHVSTLVLAKSAGDAVAAVTRIGANLVLVDASLEGEVPGHVVSSVHEATDQPCGVFSESISGEVVSLADRSGADALLAWPPDPWQLRTLANHGRIRGDALRGAELPPMVLGGSSAMRDVWRFVTLAAASSSSVLITGETGVGKEVIARALHRFSLRRTGPFVAINCAALPENLLESELLGHEKGAFTGAASRRKGRFELADGGTLFLDEVGDLPLSLQVKLLRVLQERRFERVGGNESVTVDVRVLAATHRNLRDEITRGRFRADLFYRLNVLAAHLPPLRERRPDILELWSHLLRQGAAQQGRRAPRTSPSVQRLLLGYDWPGNVRELQNAVQHTLAVLRGEEVMPSDLPSGVSGAVRQAGAEPHLAGLTMEEIERAAILQTHTALGTVKATAQALGISERKIHYRMQRYRRLGLASGRSSSVPPDPAGSEHTGLRRRVVLAEDDDELRWAMEDFLVAEGYDVVAVPDGRALLEHLGAAMLLERRDDPPDVIISDVRMPGLTGMQLLEKVRERGWTTPVVLISAFGDDVSRNRADSLGAAAFLDKPIDVSRLQQVIDAALERAPPRG
jgi:DNA-binding NtrC family response regulator